ncbi:hypothetical protein F4780DRAFT_786369, partial [Xylariomycetidae sp. FL0641]
PFSAQSTSPSGYHHSHRIDTYQERSSELRRLITLLPPSTELPRLQPITLVADSPLPFHPTTTAIMCRIMHGAFGDCGHLVEHSGTREDTLIQYCGRAGAHPNSHGPRAFHAVGQGGLPTACATRSWVPYRIPYATGAPAPRRARRSRSSGRRTPYRPRRGVPAELLLQRAGGPKHDATDAYARPRGAEARRPFRPWPSGWRAGASSAASPPPPPATRCPAPGTPSRASAPGVPALAELGLARYADILVETQHAFGVGPWACGWEYRLAKELARTCWCLLQAHRHMTRFRRNSGLGR